MDGIFCINYVWAFAYVERQTSLSSGGANERGRRESCGWEDEWVMGGVFFFSQPKCVFFSQEKFTTQHFPRSQGPETKNRWREKAIFPLTHGLSEKVSIFKLSGEKNTIPLVEHGFHVTTIFNICILKWYTLYFFKLVHLKILCNFENMDNFFLICL